MTYIVNSKRAFIKSALGLLVSGASFSGVATKNNYESRAIFDEGLHWNSPERADKLCARVSRAGFNVLMPCVWHGRGSSWSSKLTPWDDRLNSAVHKDIIKHLLEAADKYNLEVHPWFTLGLRQRDFFPEFAQNKKSGVFDYSKENFRNFAVDLVLEFLYMFPEVHGLNLDFVRFNSKNSEKGKERGLMVADVIRRIANEARRVNNNIMISLDAAPYLPKMKSFGQYSVEWAEEGIADVVYSMQYQQNPDFAKIKQLQMKMKRPDALVVMIGNFERNKKTHKVWRRDKELVSNLIEQSRSISKSNGIGLYYYGMLDDEQIVYLRNNVFADPALPHWILNNNRAVSYGQLLQGHSS